MSASTHGQGHPADPTYTSELAIRIEDHPELSAENPAIFPENPSQLQVHLLGTPRALEALGRYLIALAHVELDAHEPEPFG